MKLLGQRLMARDFDRQVAELQVRIAVLVIPPKISGVQKWNFLGKISEEIFDEDSTI